MRLTIKVSVVKDVLCKMMFRLAMVWTVQDRFLGVGGCARSTALVQTGPGAHGVSYTVGTGSITGVKRPWPVRKHPPQMSAEVKNKRLELCQDSRAVPSWSVVWWTLTSILCCLGGCRMRKATTNFPVCLAVRPVCNWAAPTGWMFEKFRVMGFTKLFGRVLFKVGQKWQGIYMNTYVRLWSLTVIFISGTDSASCGVSFDAKETFIYFFSK